MPFDLGPQAVFIVWSYIGVGVAVAGLIGLVAGDARRVKARLEGLEARGVRRRSDQPK